MWPGKQLLTTKLMKEKKKQQQQINPIFRGQKSMGEIYDIYHSKIAFFFPPLGEKKSFSRGNQHIVLCFHNFFLKGHFPPFGFAGSDGFWVFFIFWFYAIDIVFFRNCN